MLVSGLSHDGHVDLTDGSGGVSTAAMPPLPAVPLMTVIRELIHIMEVPEKLFLIPKPRGSTVLCIYHRIFPSLNSITIS